MHREVHKVMYMSALSIHSLWNVYKSQLIRRVRMDC